MREFELDCYGPSPYGLGEIMSVERPTLAALFGESTCDCLPSVVEQAIADGYLRRQVHPTEPLAILNYTEKAAYEGAWTPVTLTCRGLIYNTVTGEVVARPFAKFFNHGQVGAPDLDLSAKVTVTDKVDGSLGILYPTPDGYAIATRGSFTSEQAIHATEVWRTRYAGYFTPDPTVTYLFEVVYPEGRIVLDYYGLDDLVLLGAIDIATGADRSHRPCELWRWQRAAQFPYATLADALAAQPRPSAEGLVVYLRESGHRIKIKQADYVALHRIVTGLTARTVWQHLVDGKPLPDLIEPLPDEFHSWVQEVAEGLTSAVAAEHDRIHAAWLVALNSLPALTDLDSREGRKAFAAVAVQHPDKWALFALLDGRDIRPELLKRAKPEAFVTPSGRTYGEDTA